MEKQTELSNSQSVDQILDEVRRLDTLRAAVGYTLCAYEMSRIELFENLADINEKLNKFMGLGIRLEATEAFELIKNANVDSGPRRKSPNRIDSNLELSGILREISIFDRSELPEDDKLPMPWYGSDEERLETCFTIEPDSLDHSKSAVSKTTYVPVRKTEGMISFYESKP